MTVNDAMGSGLSAAKRALLEKRLKGREAVAPESVGLIGRRAERDAAPLSFAQQRLWFVSQLEPDGFAYNTPAAFRLEGQLDIPTLERSLNEIIRRHEILRTSFRVVGGGEPRQFIAPQLSLHIPVQDLRHLPETERRSELLRLMASEAQRPFDLEQTPLLRVKVWGVGEGQQVLLLVMHHIITDGWSMGVLVRELGALYGSYVAGAEPDLPGLNIQYGDYASWQQGWLKSGASEAELDYWRRRLAGAPSVLELPTDYPRPPVQTYNGAHESFVIPRHLVERLRALSREHEATLFMTLMAVWQTLLYRHTHQPDIVVGIPIANRTRTEIESLIGFFVNTLALRTDLSGNPTFGELLARVREAALGAYEHQDVPFERIVEELQPARSLSRSPLFQVMFVLQNAPVEALELPGVKLEPMPVESPVEMFDLTLNMVESDGEIHGALSYSTDLFEPETMRRMSGHFMRLLEASAANSRRRLDELPLLTDVERRQLLDEWSRTPFAAPAAQLLHRMFETQAGRVPHEVALVFEGETLTFSELNARANRLARYLREQGVEPDTIVGVMMERSIELVVALLGIVKAGGAYLPLDPEYPPPRLAFMLQDAGAHLLLTQQRLLDRCGATRAKVVCLDREREMFAAADEANLDGLVNPFNLAYVIYTSGSTGQPKGVMITHHAICNRLSWSLESLPLREDDRVLQVTTISFDNSVWELFTPLVEGACLVLARPHGQHDIAYLVELIRRERITVISVVPSLLRVLLEDKRFGECRSLRQVIVGGEAMPVDFPRRFFKQFDADLYNTYGPTETTIDVTWQRCEPDAPARRSIPIGRPVGNAQTYVLDERLRIVPVGVEGELYIGGGVLARGYLNRPELTAERFVPHPFGERGARLYRTGDIVRYLPGGELEFLRRVDDQVKIHGFRIEVGEIEAALAKHPSVRNVVVLVTESESRRAETGATASATDNLDAAGDAEASRVEERREKRLVAYVVPERMDALDGLQLRDYLKQHLPAHMIPTSFVLLEEFPLTPSGKLDRHALPPPERPATTASADAFVASPTAIEEILVGIWAQVLGVERVDVRDDFFEAGGHSLLAMQLMSRVREAFGVDIPVRHLFEEPALAALARRIETAMRAGQSVAAAPPLVPVPRSEAMPLSFAQQRLWFLQQLRPDSPAYNIPAALRLTGALNVDAFERSLNEIILRHEVLRTNFRQVDGRPVQAVRAFAPEPLGIDDLSGLPESVREDEARRRATGEAQRPFDLARERMMRARLLRLGVDDHVLLLTMHHIAADGWSVGILMRELSLLYQAYSTGQTPLLAELPIQYADFAQWQREWLTDEMLETQMAYWRKQLAGMPPMLELPADRMRPPVQSSRGGVETLRLNATLTDALKRLSRAEGVTLFMTLLAAFKILLSRYARRDDMVVGTPLAGRNRRETEALIGFFVNTLVLRTDLSGAPSFRALLARLREVSLGAYAHQDLPFDKLVEELQPERNLSHMPLVQVVFALQNAPEDDFQLAGLELDAMEAESATAKFDLTLNMAEAGSELFGALRYSTDLYDAATIKAMLRHFVNLLEGIVAAPDRRINALPLLNEDERRQLLDACTLDTRRFPRPRLHLLFEAQAARRPEASALAFEDERMSYAELNRRANQLAHYLRELGVAPEVRVGLLMERSPEMIVALLGVVKAGGAYVPLDPSYPHERLSFMLADAGLHVLLSVEKYGDKCATDSAQVVLLDRDAAAIARHPEHNPRDLTLADNLAYIIYTSGSTGQPKGTLVSHANLSRLFAATAGWFDFDESDAWTMFHSYAFDFSVWEMWGALGCGGKLVVVPFDVSRSPDEFYRLLRREGVTVLNQTPSAFRQLIAAEETATDGRKLNLRLVIFGGEALEPSSLKPWFERHGDAQPRLVNMYGITETTVHVTYRPLTLHDAHADAGSRIGVRLPDLKVYVLDDEMQPVPSGVAGELYVGGDGVARGYLNRPALTATRFVPDPYSTSGGERLYRTGDVARLLSDGDLEYLGRNDQQVKIRSYRIELGEIEAALNMHEGVRECVVAAREDAAGDKRLAAYLVWKREAAPASSEDLRAFLRTKLSEHMIPASFVTLDALPLTAHGKIDRRALPSPGHERPEIAEQYVAPQSALEVLLADMWREILSLDTVGTGDDFFVLGGDSIKGAVFIKRLQERLGEIVHVVAIFSHPTVGQLAAYLEEQYPSAVARICGTDPHASHTGTRDTSRETVEVDEEKLTLARQLIAPLPARRTQDATKNPPAIFVLSAPRSGSTLFRVMLAGHPELFAPPELELLSFNTLEERRDSFSGADSFWLEGTIRAVMDIKGCEAAEAKEIMRRFEQRRLTTKEFYGQMQEWLGARRLVDKTPSYALHPSILRRAEEDFDGALYIHLSRHPLGMIRSFEEARLDQIFFRYPHPFSRRELAELIWLISNRNILDFLGSVSPRRRHHVRFEDLLAQPADVMGGVCRFLGLELHPDMLQPYEKQEKRMTDGIYSESRMLGDVKFHRYRSIDARTGTRWKEGSSADSTGSLAGELARTLGYEAETDPRRDVAASPVASPSREDRPRRLPLVTIQPGGTRSPLFFVHPGTGDAFDYIHLSRRLGDDQPFFGLPGLNPLEPHVSIQERAAQSVEALRAVQPDGTYRLGGWSFGALVAFEIAQQLRRHGKEVALLALLDPMSPTLDEDSPTGDFSVDTSEPLAIARDIAALEGWDAAAMSGALAQLEPDARLNYLYQHAKAASLFPPEVTPAKFAGWLQLYHAKIKTARRYRPQPYPGQLTIFQAGESTAPTEAGARQEDSNDSVLVWSRLSTQPLHIVAVPGSHHTMVREPHVGILAEHLRSMLS